MNTSFKNLGPGLGFRPAHYHEILRDRPQAIGWLEVITENFMNIGGKPRDILIQARAHYPIAFHGVGLSIGSEDAPSPQYLRHLKDLVETIRPALVSDHLCFTSHGRHNSHDLLPIPFTKTLLTRISDRVKQIQDLLGRRFMLENPSAYVAYADNDMTEADFFAELITRTDCAMLLDLNNLYVNQMNLGEDPFAYLHTIPSHAVGQIHLAGHSTEETPWGTVRIDTHDHPIREDVWSLYQGAKKKWPDASAMVEWDDHLPELSELLPLLERIRATDAGTLATKDPADKKTTKTRSTATATLGAFFAMAVDSNGIDETDTRLAILSDTSPVPRHLGMQVYKNAYFARLRDILHSEFPTLAGVTTDEGFTAIAASYLHAEPPSEASVNRLGRNLATHIKGATIDDFDFGVDLEALADIAALDDSRSASFIHPAEERAIQLAALAEISPDAWERIHFEWNPTLTIFKTSYDVAPVWAAIHDETGELSPPEMKPVTMRVWRHDRVVHHQAMTEREALLLTALTERQPFAASTTRFAAEANLTLEDATAYAVTSLASWIQQGLVAGITF